MSVFKNLNLGGLAALVFAGFFAISWTTMESKLAKQWYQVSVSGSDSNPEKNQHILGLYPGGTPQFPCDETTGEICAIELDFNPEEEAMPTTVYEAKNNTAVSVGLSRFIEQ